MPKDPMSALYDGTKISFADFVMACARTRISGDFGDESIDAPIPEVLLPSSYHTEALKAAEADVARIEAWDDDEADRRAQLEYERYLAHYNQLLIERAARLKRFGATLALAKTWTPPTVSHQGLKSDMIKQLEKALYKDSDVQWNRISPPKRLSGADYKLRELEAAREQVRHHATSAAVDERKQPKTMRGSRLYARV